MIFEVFDFETDRLLPLSCPEKSETLLAFFYNDFIK